MKRIFSVYKRNWIIILVVVIMTILNPSYSEFKEYTGLAGKDSEHLHKKFNFLIFSIYNNDVNEHNYLAILMNFIDITPNKKYNPKVEEHDSITDSTMGPAADTSYIPRKANKTSSTASDSELDKALKQSLK
jgi:hypothetical protein